MATDPRMRASDADRDRAASALREHHAVGRLTAEEFNERLDAVYVAKTMGDLDELLSDLPAADSYQLPVPSGKAPPPVRPPSSAPELAGRLSPVWRAAWGSWLAASLACFAIWIATGLHGYPWPVWVAGPWGVVLLARWIACVRQRQQDPLDRRGVHEQRRVGHEQRRALPEDLRVRGHEMRDELRVRRNDMRKG